MILKRRVAPIIVKSKARFYRTGDCRVAVAHGNDRVGDTLWFQTGVLVIFLKAWDFISYCEALGFDDMISLALQIGASSVVNKEDKKVY